MLLDMSEAGQYYSFHPALLEICEKDIFATLVLGYIQAQESFLESKEYNFFKLDPSMKDYVQVNVRKLSEKLGISKTTASKALKYLKERQIILITEYEKKKYSNHLPMQFAKINVEVLQPLVDQWIRDNRGIEPGKKPRYTSNGVVVRNAAVN